ncbi:amino acid ABC transporter permease [Thalassospira lucentensis]|uniref:Amino acid ABC transporter permease n=1 Tax=Thalassospira lucentensis TaxID=168935 RepID=A0A358HYV1_9PROT|nr:ABC transporter permease subunit [Thalassospira lucentensis]HBV00352.1 amino acid ABC transporter permease [Thalassospira lucentensis]HCW68156.1 amino acid ABC transporter permease [Thalassospira lucentensis]|tara:strand:+ start:3476 stop:4609 length:1134 start_codon:yes stop_codon:yes gene_type:complete
MFTAIWDNEKFRSVFIQMLLLGLFVGLIWWLAGNAVSNLVARGIPVGFGFLSNPANFPISESILDYDGQDSFLWAYVVGLSNTVLIAVLTIFAATIAGLFVGLARRSSHPVLRRVADVYVNTVRNMPLVVQLLFWYVLGTTSLPRAREALEPLSGVFISVRGIFLPGLTFSGPVVWVLILVACVLIAFAVFRRVFFASRRHAAISAGGFIVFAGTVWQAAGVTMNVEIPRLEGFNFTGGLRLSVELVSLLIGMTIYTAAYIGEIIRGGIDAVDRGQWEAARSLGLSEKQVLMHIILPQALRIIIPPLTTQYISTVKNTTLALAVGYPELSLVVGTVINQTGQAIESILILLGSFLLLNLLVSIFMNWCNKKVALVQR